MQPITPKILTQKFAEHSYNHKLGWSTTAQPTQGCSTDEYIDLAEQSLLESQEQMVKFAEEYGYSYTILTQQDLYEYETGDEPNFQKWFQKKCHETSQNHKVDLLIVTSCVKNLNRAQQKALSNGNTAERIIDYQRAMYVVLKQSNGKQDNKSLKTLARLIQDIEQDQRTVARKNLFWHPHPTTGFRAHKTLRTTTVPQGQEYAGMEILTEVKIEHESQMGIDRATRAFLNIGRNTDKAVTEFNYNVRRDLSNPAFCNGQKRHTKRTSLNIGQHVKRTASSKHDVSKWSHDLYDRINYDAGLDDFLDPALREKMPEPTSYQDIVKMIKASKIHNGIARSVLQSLAGSGILPRKQSDQIIDYLNYEHT